MAPAEYGSSSRATPVDPGGEKGVDLSYQYDEVEELLATDAAFQKRHRDRTNLTRGLVGGAVALTLLALYVSHRVTSQDLKSSAMAASDQPPQQAPGHPSAPMPSDGETVVKDHQAVSMGGDNGAYDIPTTRSFDDESNWLEDLFNTVTFELHDGSLPIHGRVKITSEQPRTVRAVYGCSDTGCDKMVTPWVTTEIGRTTSIEIFRLRAHTYYNVSVEYSASDGAEEGDEIEGARTTMKTGSTGVSKFDKHPYASVTGDLGFQTFMTERSGHGFAGFIGLDPAGYVVWGMNISDNYYRSSIGDLPSHSIMQFPDYSYAVLCQGEKQLMRIDAAGNQVGNAWQPTFENGCSALSHEVFVDNTMTGNEVLTLMHEVVAFEGTPTAYTLGQKIVRWNHTTNAMVDIFNIFDIMDPREVVSWEDPFFPGSLECTSDDGVYGTYGMSDFSHCNSAATGNQENYLLSSRATSTVISIAKDGSGVQWMVSTDGIGVNSNLTFVDESAKFYNQHFVRQLDDNNIVMIDNGNTRPAVGGETSSFSRACEYKLDFEAKTIELVWEFAPTGIFTVEGGSIDALKNGNRIVHFPFIVPDTSSDQYYSNVYEVNSDGDEVASMFIPWLGNSSEYDTPTRGLAVDSIFGETTYTSSTDRR